ncbi:hypothetical protein LCGC14_1910530, partial [marine sediment metagenome]
GKEYTTFEASAETLTVGTVLKLDKVTITEKDGKTKHDFKEFEVVSKPTGGASPAPGQPSNGMTPQDWAEKDRLERRSREANACFMGLPALIAGKPVERVLGGAPRTEGEVKAVEVWMAAMNYALAHFTPAHVTMAGAGGMVVVTQGQGEKDWQKMIEDGSAWTPEGFTKRCKDAGIPWLDVKAILGVNNVKEIANYAQAWATVKEEADKQKESQTTTNN